MPVIEIPDDNTFEAELNKFVGKLVVVDFHATWCEPCKLIAPAFSELSNRYPAAVFLKVDVDKCPNTGGKFGVTAMPTFLFLRNKVELGTVTGADRNKLESSLKEFLKETVTEDSPVKGHIDLKPFIYGKGCECLNESDKFTLTDFLSGKNELRSDCDEQLLITIAFSQSIKLHSIRLSGPGPAGPKDVKLFTNLQDGAADFDKAESMEPVQMLTLAPDDILSSSVIPLRYVKLQNVSTITLFVASNQGDEEVTVLTDLRFYGSPVAQTNMGDFKRVSGQPGEVHG